MGALVDIYVNPAINANSGSGTLGDPWGDLQYALNTATRDTSNGNRINVKAGTAEVLAVPLDFSTWGNPATGAPTVFQGYTSAALDGGIGAINCNSNNLAAIVGNSPQNVEWSQLDIYGSGSADLTQLCTRWVFDRCKLHDCATAVVFSVNCRIVNCHIYDCSALGVSLVGASSDCMDCDFANGTKSFTAAIRVASASIVTGNIIKVSGASLGIEWTAAGESTIAHNTVWSAGGTGSGLICNGGATAMLLNNIVEGFSGSGGVGVNLASNSPPRDVVLYAANYLFNNATNESFQGDVWLDITGGTVLAETPFTDAANGDFRIKAGMVGSVRAYPSTRYGFGVADHRVAGALQPEGTSGGGGIPVIMGVG